MLRLTSVFTSHALFQHSAPLTVKGECTAPLVSVFIERDGAVLSTPRARLRAAALPW